MRYSELLKKQRKCPFCILEKKEIIKDNRYGKIILTRAPYEEDHLLIVSNKHASRISELTKNEKFGLFELLLWAEEKIRKIHGSYSILYREGDRAKIGKSVEHLHVHLVPNVKMMSAKKYTSARKAYDKQEYFEKTEEMKKKLRGDRL